MKETGKSTLATKLSRVCILIGHASCVWSSAHTRGSTQPAVSSPRVPFSQKLYRASFNTSRRAARQHFPRLGPLRLARPLPRARRTHQRHGRDGCRGPRAQAVRALTASVSSRVPAMSPTPPGDPIPGIFGERPRVSRCFRGAALAHSALALPSLDKRQSLLLAQGCHLLAEAA